MSTAIAIDWTLHRLHKALVMLLDLLVHSLELEVKDCVYVDTLSYSGYTIPLLLHGTFINLNIYTCLVAGHHSIMVMTIVST